MYCFKLVRCFAGRRLTMNRLAQTIARMTPPCFFNVPILSAASRPNTVRDPPIRTSPRKRLAAASASPDHPRCLSLHRRRRNPRLDPNRLTRNLWETIYL